MLRVHKGTVQRLGSCNFHFDQPVRYRVVYEFFDDSRNGIAVRICNSCLKELNRQVKRR